jgi:hypothetical protein
MLHNNDILIVGNARELKDHLVQLRLKENTKIIGFNKIALHSDELPFELNYIICNDVIFHHLNHENHTLCINEFDVHAEDTTFELTTGLLFIKWILKFIRFNSMTIVGFNMVEPGQSAHFFDDETPGNVSSTFKGHNAKYERNFLKKLHNDYSNIDVIFS